MLQVRGQPSNANGILGDYWYFLIRGALEGDNFITEYIVLTNVNQEPIPLLWTPGPTLTPPFTSYTHPFPFTQTCICKNIFLFYTVDCYST